MTKKVKLKVLLNRSDEFVQPILSPQNKHSKEFTRGKGTRVSIVKALLLFKDQTLLEITIKEVKQ